MSQYKERYRRHLPHIVPLDGMFHVVFRTKNSISGEMMGKLSDKLEEIRLELFQGTEKSRSLLLARLYQENFEEYECLLHKDNSGDLKDEKLAVIVKDAIEFYNYKTFKLIAYSIMPNHVHLMVGNVKQNLSSILKSIKGYSAYRINKIKGTKGVFWQDESYDHMIRSRNEMGTTIDYILNNPVKAGLCEHYSQHPFTWCDPKYVSRTF